MAGSGRRGAERSRGPDRSRLLGATRSPHKLRELRELLGAQDIAKVVPSGKLRAHYVRLGLLSGVHQGSQRRHFGRLVAHQKIQGVCARLLGEQVTNFASMALSKPARIGGEKPWHQDHAYFEYPLGTPVVGGRASGNITCQNAVYSPQPSMIADSRKAPGNDLKKPVSTRIVKGRLNAM